MDKNRAYQLLLILNPYRNQNGKDCILAASIVITYITPYRNHNGEYTKDKHN